MTPLIERRPVILRWACVYVATMMATANAGEGDPVAIEIAPDGKITVESFWGLSSSMAHDPVADGNVIELFIDRRPNQTKEQIIRDPADANQLSDHAMSVSRFASASLVKVDGVAVLIVPDDSASPINQELLNGQRLDALVIPSRNQKLGGWIESFAPRMVMVHSAHDLPADDNAPQTDQDIIASVAKQTKIALDDIKILPANTAPVSSVAGRPDAAKARTKVIVLQTTTAVLPDELESLFQAKEQQARKTAKVFEPLSAKQLNWSPPNGTHTPRWNVEHMMGRELLFFSQIFHQRNDEIPVMNLNPEQMPPDYVAAHPDWEGHEEVRQIERVTKFTRRFAYLMKDLPLDEKAPGSGWTPRRLLKQMDWHYSDHTSKTKLKFQLPEWPK